MKHLFLSCLLVSALSVNAQSTFYVDQNNSAASDDNAGTADAPWATLNVAKWTDGCTVMLKGEYYMDATETNEITVNATLAGTDNAVIYGYEEGEEVPADYLTFFTCSDKKLTVKDLNISNFNNTANENWGGIFEFGEGSELILENVNISNVFLGGDGRRGGAISTSGKITATNVTFENCTACKGGAVSILGNNPAKFTSCSFIGNNNNLGIECGAKGGALYIRGDEGTDVTLDKCYFERNISDSEGQDHKYSAGGAIALYGASPKLHVSNSTFVGNVAGWAAGILFFEKKADIANAIDIRFANNTFIDNTVLNSGTNQGVLIYINGGSSDNVSGLFSMVNNTSFNNNTSNTQSGMFMNSCPFDVVFANNLSLDKKVIEINGNPVELGWGWVLQENYPTLFKSVQISHNIIEGGIGGDHMSFTSESLSTDELANIFPDTSLRPSVGLASAISMEEGIGCLPLDANSIAIDAGINDIMLAGENLIPATDIRGYATVNGKRDLGAWEYGASSGVEAAIAADNASLIYDRAAESIIVSEKARFINVYDLTGALVAHAADTDLLHIANLPQGIFVAVAIIDNAPVSTKIIR